MGDGIDLSLMETIIEYCTANHNATLTEVLEHVEKRRRLQKQLLSKYP